MIEKYNERKFRKRKNLFFTDEKSKPITFDLQNLSGVIRLKTQGDRIRVYYSSQYVFIRTPERNIFLVLEGEAGYNFSKSEMKMKSNYLFELFEKKSKDVIIGKLDKGIFDKIRGALSDYKADLKEEKLSEGYVQYTVISKPNESEKECEKVFTKTRNAYYMFIKKDDNQRQYEGLLQILEKGFFIKICRKFEKELGKCFNYMNENISINENLAELLQISIEMSEDFSRVKILINICKYLDYDISFVSSICANGGYEELKKVFEEFTNEEFLLKCRNLLHKKDEKGNDLLKRKKNLDVLLGKGFEYFKYFLSWIQISDNLQKLTQQNESPWKLDEEGVVSEKSADNLECHGNFTRVLSGSKLEDPKYEEVNFGTPVQNVYKPHNDLDDSDNEKVEKPNSYKRNNNIIKCPIVENEILFKEIFSREEAQEIIPNSLSGNFLEKSEQIGDINKEVNGDQAFGNLFNRYVGAVNAVYSKTKSPGVLKVEAMTMKEKKLYLKDLSHLNKSEYNYDSLDRCGTLLLMVLNEEEIKSMAYSLDLAEKDLLKNLFSPKEIIAITKFYDKEFSGNIQAIGLENEFCIRLDVDQSSTKNRINEFVRNQSVIGYRFKISHDFLSCLKSESNKSKRYLVLSLYNNVQDIVAFRELVLKNLEI